MIQTPTETNPVPVAEPNKPAPGTIGPQQTDEEKKAAADKAKAEQNPAAKS